jgi:hypothetical protein
MQGADVCGPRGPCRMGVERLWPGCPEGARGCSDGGSKRRAAVEALVKGLGGRLEAL